jgi:Cu/Ag efflux pump CusA
MMIAAGVIIDDAITGVDSIIRRLRATPVGGNGKASSILAAVIEMRSSFVYATLILILAMAPALLLEGVSGAIFGPLARAYILALVASFVVALTATPSLSLLLLNNSPVRSGQSIAAGILRAVYRILFGWAIRAPRTAVAVLGAILVAGLLTIPYFRQESLLPDFKETDLVVRWDGNTSASHAAMGRIATLASRELRTIKGVHNVSAQVGRAVMSDKQANVNAGELWVSIDPEADYDATVAQVKRVVASYPGPSAEVLTYTQARFRQELSGTGQSLIVRVYGKEMDILRSKAEEVQKMLASTQGVVNPKVQYPAEMPTLEIEVNLDKANRYGLKPGDVRRSATAMVAGLTVGHLFEDQKVFEVTVYGTPEVRNSVTSIQDLLIDTPSHGHVALKEVADVRIVPAVTAIQRDSVARRIDVTFGVVGRDLAAVADAVHDGIEKIEFPLEYRAEMVGEYAELAAAQDRVRVFAIAAAIGIFLLLQVCFRSWRLAAAMFVSLPTALAGSALTVYFADGGLLSLGSIIGFLGVFGIAVRQGIALIGRYNRYRELEGSKSGTFGAALIERATEEQAAPILMTVVTTAFAFAPFAFSGSVAGLEILQPIATVMLGGLVTTAINTLVGVPAVYLLFGGVREAELGLEEVSGTAIAGGEMPPAMAA